MMESQSMKPAYQLRLLERIAFYEEVRFHRFFDWPKGTVITDQTEIEMIEARGAQVERIEIDPKLSPPPIPQS